MSWKVVIEEDSPTVFTYKIKENNHFLTFEQVFNYWQSSVDFVTFYVSMLEKCPFEAVYWEHPALEKSYLNKEYECKLLQSNSLPSRQLDTEAFADYIHQNTEVVTFMNLGKNAKLVVPTLGSHKEVYKHFVHFVRFAEKAQVLELFVKIGQSMYEELAQDKVIWLNTAGLGVIWLHIRLDTYPKYYKTRAYKEADFLEKN